MMVEREMMAKKGSGGKWVMEGRGVKEGKG